MRNPRPSPVSLYLSELSPGSRPTMRRGLRTACEFLGGKDPDTFSWHRVRVDRVAALRSDLAGRFAPNTANKVLAAVKGVLRASWRMGSCPRRISTAARTCGRSRAVRGSGAGRSPGPN